MAYENIEGLLSGGGGAADTTLDPQTQALLDILYRRPVAAVRPADPTPFRQQTPQQKTESITSALADIARIVQNSHLKYGEQPRGVGFSANLAGERDALAREEADRQTRDLQAADTAERGRAGYELRSREQAAQEERALRRAEERRTLDLQDEEVKNLRELKEAHADEVATYLPEMQDDLLAAKNSTKALQIIGAAAAARRLAEKQEKAASEARADARSGGIEARAIAREDRKAAEEQRKALRLTKAGILGSKVEVKTAIKTIKAARGTVTEDDLNEIHQDYLDKINAVIAAQDLTPEQEEEARQYFDAEIAGVLRREVGALQEAAAKAEDERGRKANPIVVTPERRNGTLIGGF